ncbi:Adenylate cyclase type 10, partial [Haplosporangium sp. Z 27]
NIIIGNVGGGHGLESLLVQNTGRLEYAICGEQMATLEDALNLAHAGEITLTQCAWQYVKPESYPKSECRGNCFILKSHDPSISAEIPLMKRVRNEKLLNKSVRSNPHYYKYLNKSAIYRLILNPNGFIQQFAVDDKGATLLCAFGLPYPHSHENEAIFAAKAAWLIQQEFLRKDIGGFRISLATGVIFTSSIGNEFRRDPAIVGDTIVIAVRILKFEYANNSVVCDDSTMLACTADKDGLCEFEYMGEEYVKGKSHPLQIWRLVHFGAMEQIPRPDDIMIDENIGYEAERDKVSSFISSWSRTPDRNTLLVMGPRGSGKSLFFQQISHIAEDNGYRIFSARTAEVERITEYFPVRFLLLSFFDIMLKNEIPYSNKMGSIPTNWSDGTDLSVTLSDLTLTSDPSIYTSEVRSPAICRYGESCRSKQADMTKLQAIIEVCLEKMGDRANGLEMPELDRIISAISSENSTFTMKMEDDNILANFITTMLNYMSRFVKVIIILEDTQWSDPKTLNIFKAIHVNCPSVLVILFSRPQRDYGFNNIIKSITNHPKHLEIALEGLKGWEIEQALLRAFKPNGVNRISPEIMQLVMEQTKGNPRFVKNMSLMLQEFCHVNIVDGELLTTGKSANSGSSSKATEEMLLKQDRKKVTLMQYDRIRPKFQDFLKISSCLGENFSLAEVAAIKPLENLLGAPDDKNLYTGAINNLDTFKFLSLAQEQQANIQFSSNVALQTIYTFRSSSTSHDIYDSIPFEERVGYHLQMAQFYESFLEPSEDPTKQPLNCQDLLPQITYHYMKTDATQKKIKYLKALAAFHLKSNMLTESTDNVNELIRIIDTDQDAKKIVSQEDLADVYGMKGVSLAKRMRIEEAEVALKESLAKYGVVWPTTKSQWKRELMKENLKFKYYYHRGMIPVVQKPGRKLQKFKGDLGTYVRLARIIQVLSCIQNIYYWITKPDAAMLSCLYTLKYSRRLGIPSGDQTVSLARIAILHYYQGNKTESEKFMNDARRRNQAGDTTGGMFEALEAYIEFNEGHYDNSHRILDKAITESKSFGVVTHLAAFYRAVTQKVAYRIWEGTFNAHPDDWQLLRTLSAVAMQNGDSEGETLFAIPTAASLLLQDRVREAESWIFLLERFILPKTRLLNLTAVFGVLSFYYAKVRSYQKSRVYIDMHSQKIVEQPASAHPFPLMSCMFSLMAMYEIHNSAYFALGNELPGTTPINKNRGIVILHRIITYLQTDSFKLVANPLIHLADAMCSFIIIHNNKEGGVRLARGYQSIHSTLSGIGFIKAYYLSQLGRHSSPDLKRKYHLEAHNLFHSMGMDSAIWLNDPIQNNRRCLQKEGEKQQGQLDNVSDRTCPSSYSSVPSIQSSEGTVLSHGTEPEWGESRPFMDSADFKGKSLSFPLKLSPVGSPVGSPATIQDDGNSDRSLSNGVELDEHSFDIELAVAAIPFGTNCI